MMFQPYREDCLLHLALERALRRQIQHAGELLCDRAAAFAGASREKVVQGRAHYRRQIKAAVLIKATVFYGNNCLCQIRRQILWRQ